MKLMIAAMGMTMTAAASTLPAMEVPDDFRSQRHVSQGLLLAELQKERRRVVRRTAESVTTASSIRAEQQHIPLELPHQDIREVETAPRRLVPLQAPGFEYHRPSQPDLNPRVSL